MTTVEYSNFRDVGGVRTTDGGIIRPGVLYRSETLPAGAPRPVDAPIWPPRTVIDLRLGDREHELSGTGAVIHRMPMAPWLDPEAIRRDNAAGGPVDLPDRYVRMINNARDRMPEVIDTVAGSDGPVLVHCMLGKDRTGILIAILLAAVGVSREDILADYERTRDNMAVMLESLVGRGQAVPENQAILAVSPAALLAVLDVLDSAPGGVEGWLLEQGVSAESLRRLRDRLVEPQPSA